MVYYCHHCRRHINRDELLPEFACPSCRSGFVEELETPPTHGNIIQDVLYDFITGVSMGSQLPGDLSSSSSTSSQTNATQSGSANSSFGADRLLNLDVPFIQLNSHIGDYAWGNAGFDAVISQLLNNLDGSNMGLPPMPREQMDELPTFKISDEHLNSNNSQCTVCLEDFKIGDIARRLPCDHYFHQGCLIPWLKLHASCPVCRKAFVGQNTTEQSETEASNDTQRPSSSGRRVFITRRSTSTGQGTSGSTSETSSSNPNVNLKEEDCD